MRIVIEALNGPSAGKVRVFEGQVAIRIGRDPSCDFSLDAYKDLKTSGRHGEIILKDGFAYFRDLGSSNGTYLEGRKLAKGEEVLLRDGDVVGLGAGGTKLRISFPDSVRDTAVVGRLDTLEVEDASQAAIPGRGNTAIVVTAAVTLLMTGIFVVMAMHIAGRKGEEKEEDAEKQSARVELAGIVKKLESEQLHLKTLKKDRKKLEKEIENIRTTGGKNNTAARVSLRDKYDMLDKRKEEIKECVAEVEKLQARKLELETLLNNKTPLDISGSGE